MTYELPKPSTDALIAYRDLTSDMMQWASTAHELVVERIAALVEASGRTHDSAFGETAAQYVGRTIAKGQRPFPAGVSLYDDGNSNVAYSHVQVGYALAPDTVATVFFSGAYPQWAADGESYETKDVQIHVPASLLTNPDGVEQFRAQTAVMVEQAKADRAAEDAWIEERMALAVAVHREMQNGACADADTATDPATRSH